MKNVAVNHFEFDDGGITQTESKRRDDVHSKKLILATEKCDEEHILYFIDFIVEQLNSRIDHYLHCCQGIYLQLALEESLTELKTLPLFRRCVVLGELIEEDFIAGMRRAFIKTNEEFYLGDVVDEDVNQNWVN